MTLTGLAWDWRKLEELGSKLEPKPTRHLGFPSIHSRLSTCLSYPRIAVLSNHPQARGEKQGAARRSVDRRRATIFACVLWAKSYAEVCLSAGCAVGASPVVVRR